MGEEDYGVSQLAGESTGASSLIPKLFRNNPMQAFANEEDISDLHVPQIRFGGDVGLKPRTEGFAEQISERGEDQSEGNEHESPTGGFDSSKRRPGKGRRENRRGNEVGPTSRVDCESAFAGFEPRHRFCCRRRYIFELNIPQQKKTCRVVMSSHGCSIGAREDVKRGMFERVISSCFENKREIEDHVTIIHATSDVCHAINGVSLN